MNSGIANGNVLATTTFCAMLHLYSDLDDTSKSVLNPSRIDGLVDDSVKRIMSNNKRRAKRPAC